MQPALSLTYSSQAGNGLVGMGWSINGLSAITRCAANMALDGYKGGINYDKNDKFCLDGQRLIPKAPFGGAVQEYRTEPDTFTRVFSYGTTLSGADYFTAEAKSGLITEYGKTADSKIEAQGSTEVRVWAANKLTNRVGNYIVYFYVEDAGTGEYRPNFIAYTGNASTVTETFPYNLVRFSYEPRPLDDVAPFYQGGSVVTVTKRLTEITTCLVFDCNPTYVATKYILKYQQSPATKRSQLSSVQKCPGDGTCLPATTMTWSDQGVSNLAGKTDSGWNGGTLWNAKLLDDVFGGREPNFGDPYGSFMKTRTPIYQDAFVASVSGIAGATDTGSLLMSSWAAINIVASFAINPLTGAISYILAALVKYISDWFTFDYNVPKGKLGDANGDGRTDITGFAKKIDPSEYVWLSKKLSSGKNEFDRQDSWDTKSVRQFTADDEVEPDESKLADFNGDGLMDVVAFEEKNGFTASDAYVYLSNGVDDFTFEPALNLQDIGRNEKVIGRSALADFNGDGKSDIQVFSADKHGAINLSTGTTFEEQGDWGFCNTLNIDCGNNDHPLDDVVLGDVNGDNKADIVVLSQSDTFPYNNKATIWFTNKAGNDWVDNDPSDPDDDPVVYDFQHIFDRHSKDVPAAILPGDFNGDGKMDLGVFAAFSNQYQVNDTDGDGKYGTDDEWEDVAVYDSSFDVYLSTGQTFTLAPSFYKEFRSEKDLHIAPFALGEKNVTGHKQYAEGSNITFLPRLGDFNGDGTTDVMIFDVYKNHNAHLWLSDGSRLREEVNPGFAPSAQYWGGGFGIVDEDALGDFDGDGRVDVLQFAAASYAGQLHVTLSSSYPFPDQMTRITDGFGKKDEFEYKPISDDAVYPDPTRAAGLDSETFNFRGPLYVVSEHRTSNGIGGMYKQDYTYYGAKSHRSYGFLGFSKIVINDPQTLTTETVEYEQTYPLICHIKSRTVSQNIAASASAQVAQQQSGVLSEHTMKWDVSLGNASHKIQLESETDIQYELDGDELSNTRINYLYDAYNSVIEQKTIWPGAPVIAETITNTYFNNEPTWMLGLPTSTKVERFEPVPVPAKVVNRVFDTTKRLLTSSTEMLQAGRTLKTEFLNYDEFGNARQIKISGMGTPPISTRTTDIAYNNTKGRFPSSITNALGETTATEFEPKFGQVIKITDPNTPALVTSWKYDTFGREVMETRPDGTTSATSFCLPTTEGSYRPGNAVHWIQNKTSGVPDQTTFVDERGREVRISTIGFDGRRVYEDSLYDPVLRLQKVSQPRFQNELSSYTEFAYDVRERVTSQLAPNGAQTTFSYDGNVVLDANPFPAELTSELLWHQIRETNALGEKTDYLVNRLNQVNRVSHRDSADVLLSRMTYSDDAFDNPLRVADESGNITTRTYVDDRMTALSDPDAGNSIYTYDVLGNLKSMTDANGNTVDLNYDPLDRLTSRLEPEGQSTWIYGSTSPNIGRLMQTTGHGPVANRFVETYEYDGFGRPLKTNTTVPGDAASPFVTERTYDALGRVQTLKYPGPDSFKVWNVYNGYGYLSQVRKTDATGPLFWQANSLNAAGQLTQQTQGNATPGNATIRSTFAYDKMFNITDIKHGDRINGVEPVNGVKKHLTYAYNSTNNLTEQRNLIRSTLPAVDQDYVDRLEYDPLNRLTRKFSFMDDHLLQQSFPRDDLTYKLNAIGNITHKSDLSVADPNYFYSGIGQGPHAVSEVAGNAYTYDANGNMRTGRDFQNGQTRTISWFSYNKPFQITETGKSLTLTYDSYRDKIKQFFSNTSPATTKTTEYVGSIYEKVINSAPGPTEHKYYIYGNSPQPVAMYTTRTSAPLSDIRYFHYDNLGSLDLITNATGGVVENLSYDPHGVRRNADWTATPNKVASLTAHGFTNHDHLDDFGLIDMKGRMYDPKIGRFISADPYITDPFLTENLNRYSYVNNSPTNFIDPTGFQELPGFTPVIGTTVLQEVVITATIDAVAMPTSFVTSLAQSLAISGGIHMETVARLSKTTSMSPEQPYAYGQPSLAAAMNLGQYFARHKSASDLAKSGRIDSDDFINNLPFAGASLIMGIAGAGESIYKIAQGKGTWGDAYNVVSAAIPFLGALRAMKVIGPPNTTRDIARDIAGEVRDEIVGGALNSYSLPSGNPKLQRTPVDNAGLLGPTKVGMPRPKY